MLTLEINEEERGLLHDALTKASSRHDSYAKFANSASRATEHSRIAEAQRKLLGRVMKVK